MHGYITEGNDISPFDSRVLLPKISRQAGGGFTDYCEFLKHGASQQIIPRKLLTAFAANKPAYRYTGINDVGEV